MAARSPARFPTHRARVGVRRIREFQADVCCIMSVGRRSRLLRGEIAAQRDDALCGGAHSRVRVTHQICQHSVHAAQSCASLLGERLYASAGDTAQCEHRIESNERIASTPASLGPAQIVCGPLEARKRNVRGSGRDAAVRVRRERQGFGIGMFRPLCVVV